jgi:hypothetical protein
MCYDPCVFTAVPVCVCYTVPIAKLFVCVFITAGPIQSCSRGGRGDMGGHVLRETTSRGLCGLVCSSRTSERGGREIV